MAFNPNAVFISPSSIADFDKCPQLYYYRNVYRSPRGLKIQIINPSLALGQSIHDALEIFVRLPIPERTKESLLSKFDFIWNNLSGERGGYTSTEEEKAFKARGLAMLDRFMQNDHFLKTEMFPIPNFPKAELGDDLILTGKLDWLEKDEQGLHLIDFKTGKNEEREDSMQLPIYGVLVSELFKDSQVRASYWYLDSSSEIVDYSLPDLKETKEKLKQKGEIIKMTRQTQSFRCQSGGESCWACKDILAVAQGKGKLVTMDPVNRKQEIYILNKEIQPAIAEKSAVVEDLPF